MAGHEHWVNTPISAGVLDDSNRPHVEFRVDAGKMVVKPDPKIDGKTQAQIQKDMQDITLESARYPEIAFRSSRISSHLKARGIPRSLFAPRALKSRPANSGR